MRALGTFLLVVFAALVIGAGSAIYVVADVEIAPDVRIGPWHSSQHVGGSEAGLYRRAMIARTAMLALTREEAVYFIASTDDAGQALTSSCRYSVVGADMPARWWSITVYGPDYYLVPSETNKYSYTKTDMQAAGQQDFLFELARTGGAVGQSSPVMISGNHADAKFSLLLRLYHPDASVLDAPGALALPQITNLGCV
jgi:hypothetical protein